MKICIKGDSSKGENDFYACDMPKKIGNFDVEDLARLFVQMNMQPFIDANESNPRKDGKKRTFRNLGLCEEDGFVLFEVPNEIIEFKISFLNEAQKHFDKQTEEGNEAGFDVLKKIADEKTS